MKKVVISVCILLVIGTIVAIFSMDNKSNHVYYSYENLSESEKLVVDGVLNSYNSWENYYDSGRNFNCSNVSFFLEDGQLIFATCYNVSKEQNIGNGISSMTGVLYKIFEVNSSDGTLSGHSYSVHDSITKNTAMVNAFCGAEFSNNLSLSEKQDILANEYYKAFKN